MKKKLILESGEVFHGQGFGANTDTLRIVTGKQIGRAHV